MSTTERRIVELYAEGRTGPQIAEDVGWSLHRVYQALKRHGVRRRPRGPQPDSVKRERTFDMRAEGASLSAIGRAFGVSKQRVHQVLGSGS